MTIPAPAAIAPFAKSSRSTSAPARQPSSRATLEAPGLPDPLLEDVAAVGSSHEERARERPEQPRDRHDQGDDEHAPPILPPPATLLRLALGD